MLKNLSINKNCFSSLCKSVTAASVLLLCSHTTTAQVDVPVHLIPADGSYYLSARSTDELLENALGKGDEFLDTIDEQAGDPPFCDDAPQAGLKLLESFFKFVPGAGKIPELVKIFTQFGVIATCKGGGLNYTWDEIMEAVDKKIDIALTDLQRRQMKDLYGYFSLEFASQTDLIELAGEGQLSEDEILLVIGQLENIITDVEAAEVMFGVGKKWAQVTYLPYLYSLKYNIQLVLVELYSAHGNLENLAQNHLNLSIPQSRMRAIKNIEEANDHYGRFVYDYSKANATYQLKVGRTGPFSSYERFFTLDIYQPNGDRNRYESECHGALCNGSVSSWYNHVDDKLADAADTYKNMWKKIYSTRDETFRDFVEASNYFKGEQLVLVPFSSNIPFAGERNACMRADNHNYKSADVKMAVCEMNQGHNHLSGLNIDDRNNNPDTWRFHDKSGLLINEATGLCLDIASNDSDIVLNQCNYDLDPEREEKTSQEWAVLEHGFIVNRKTGQCLNTPSDNSSFAVLGTCKIANLKPRTVDLGDHIFRPTQGYRWKVLRTENCDDTGACELDRNNWPYSTETSVPSRREQAKDRFVLPADTIDKFHRYARIDDVTNGFTDTGFLEMSRDKDYAQWEDLEVIAGKYQMTVYYNGGTKGTRSGLTIDLKVNEQLIEANLAVPELNAGDTQVETYIVDLPKFGNKVALASSGNSGIFLIDKVIFTPISE